MTIRIRKPSTFTLSDKAKQALLELCEMRGQKQSVAVERMILRERAEADKGKAS